MDDYINPARILSLSLTRTEFAKFTKALEPRHHLVARLRWALDETAAAPLRKELGKAEWDMWLRYGCPIPATAARRYANEARRLREAA